MLDQDITTFAQSNWDWPAGLGPRLIGGLLILVIGLLLARFVSRGAARLRHRTGRIEPTVTPVVRAIIR